MTEKCKYCNMTSYNDNIIHRSKHEYIDLTGYLIYLDDTANLVIASRPAVTNNECIYTQTMLLLYGNGIQIQDMPSIHIKNSEMWLYSDMFINCKYEKAF